MACLIGVVVRHERRLRVRLDAELAPAAFLATTFYSVTNRDGRAVSPPVVGALVVSSDLHQVELALGADLVDGALYEVTVSGAPNADGSTTTGATLVRPGQAPPQPTESTDDDIARVLYGVDLVHDGDDYLEGADGDLDTIAGEANLEAALQRRLVLLRYR